MKAERIRGLFARARWAMYEIRIRASQNGAEVVMPADVERETKAVRQARK